MPEETLTHRDLARQLGVSETTVKSYRAKFPTFLPVARQGKPVRLHAEALAVCLRIRELFGQGLSVSQVCDALRHEFKEYPHNRRLSISRMGPVAEQRPAEGLLHIAELQRQALDEVRLAQEMALRRSEERIGRLEEEVRNLATMEAASKALIAELLAELRAERKTGRAVAEAVPPDPAPSAPPAPDAAPQGETVLTARKIVTVHGRQGASSYALDREPKPEPPLPEPPRPSTEFLSLPAVILSERGEFLGLRGGQSIARLVQALAPLSGSASGSANWVEDSAPPAPPSWTCLLPLDGARQRELTFTQTKTPRGNLVGLIRSMRVGRSEASPLELQDFFRQLRDRLT